MKFIFFALISMLFVIPLYTKAASDDVYLTNINGIEISEEDYYNFLKLRTHEYIMTMTKDKYEKLKSLDYSNIKTDTKYFETIYNPQLRLTSQREITEEEYENPIMPILETDGNYYENQTKRITLSLAGGTYWNYVVLTTTWKGIPGTRSFDVIGIRGNGVSFRTGSQKGEQIYIVGDKYNIIDYSWNGTNIKRLDNGFGISMNVINEEKLGLLQMSIECDVTPTENYSYIFGSYQHALTNVSLEDSHNYTMGGAGLGGVFVFPLSISQKYDGMSGTRLEYY